MKNIVLTGLVTTLLLASCNKGDQKVEGPTVAEQKLDYQAKQLEIEKQKLAIEKEKFAFEQEKKADSLDKAKKTAVAASSVAAGKANYAGNTNYTPRKNVQRGVLIVVTLVIMEVTQITEVQEIAATAMQEYSNHKREECLQQLKVPLSVL